LDNAGTFCTYSYERSRGMCGVDLQLLSLRDAAKRRFF